MSVLPNGHARNKMDSSVALLPQNDTIRRFVILNKVKNPFGNSLIMDIFDLHCMTWSITTNFAGDDARISGSYRQPSRG
jgi:hypothetical protein